MTKLKYRFPLFLLCLLHIFLGLNGLTGGILLIIKSDGSLLGMQTGWLNHSPFKTYFIPGVLLSFFIGIIPLITFIGLVKRYDWQLTGIFNIYRNRHWAWSFSLYTGIIAVSWITVQLMLTQYFWIQPIIIFTGLLIIIMTMLPDVMKHFELSGDW